MRVRFEKDALDDPNSWRFLDRIVDHFATERHIWKIDNADDIENSEWLNSGIQGRSEKQNLDMFKYCCKDSAYSVLSSGMHSITLIITNCDSSDRHHLKPYEACRCLDKPAYVVVENSTSDGAFIEAMIYAFNRRELSDAHTERWWEFHHVGGTGEIIKQVDEIISKTDGPLRIFVMKDSDGLYPGHINENTLDIESDCKNKNIPCHILIKRESENYLPIDVLDNKKLPLSKIHKKTFKAFSVLKQYQKDFYDMKYGFKKDPHGHAIVPEEQKKLFAHLSQKILDKLIGGFGKRIGEYFKDCRDMITKENMKISCLSDPDEIDKILNNIESLI